MEGSALCLVFCSTLAAIVFVIPVLCSLILRSLHSWVIMGTTLQFALNETPPARPNLGFTICHLAFSLGSRASQGSSLFKPPGQCSSQCWSKLSDVRSYQGQLWASPPDVWLIRCALRTRYVQLLSGCRRIRRSCWTCIIIVEDVL